MRPAIKLPPVQPGEGVGESSATAGIAGAPAADIAAAPPIIDIGIAGAPPIVGMAVCGIMLGLGFIDAGVADVPGAFAPAPLAVIAAGDPAVVLTGIIVEGIAALPAVAAGIAAVGGWVPVGSDFEPLPLQAAQTRINPSETPSRETPAICTGSSITPLLCSSRSERCR